MSPTLKELASHVAVQEHTYGHWLQISVKVIMAVHVKVVQVPFLLWGPIIIVNQDTVALIALLQSCTPVILSGMVQGVRVKVVAAALLHGSLWI